MRTRFVASLLVLLVGVSTALAGPLHACETQGQAHASHDCCQGQDRARATGEQSAAVTCCSAAVDCRDTRLVQGERAATRQGMDAARDALPSALAAARPAHAHRSTAAMPRTWREPPVSTGPPLFLRVHSLLL